MIALGFAEDVVSVREGAVDHLAALLLRHADRSHDGRLSFEEFDATLDGHPGIAASIEKSGARWVSVNEDAADRVEAPTPIRSRLKRALENRRPYLFFLALWVVTNVFLFEHARHLYGASNAFVQVARGCGACLNLNGALILLPMMRRLLTTVRRTLFRSLVPLDDAIALHAIAGHAMFVLAVGHTAAHLANFASRPGAAVAAQVLATSAGRTGLLWLAIFGVMWFFARASARARRRFEVFHATHALYVVWFIVGILHGPVFWKWVALPMVAFAIERIVRVARRARRTEIVQTRVLRSGVTRLDLHKPEGFTHRAGDFVFLRIPSVAKHEWHPLTISSAPERGVLSLHVRALGDWTAAVRQLAETRALGGPAADLPAFVDGPYGAPSTDVFRSRRPVLIAGGIGVTPFASVLESIVLRSRTNAALAIDRVDFVWLNRDQYSFEWFFDLLASLDRLVERGLVRVHIYMTGGRSDAASAAFDLAARGTPRRRTGRRDRTPDRDAHGQSRLARPLQAIARENRAAPRSTCTSAARRASLERVAPLCADAGMRFQQERF